MQESNEFSSIEPIAGDAPSERPDAFQSANENSASQNTVSPNFVEIYQIPKPVPPPDEEEETEEAGDEELPSAITFAACIKAHDRGEAKEAGTLYYKYQAQLKEEAAAAKQAQERAAEAEKVAREDPAYEGDEEDEECPHDEEPSSQPDLQFAVKIGGVPGKTTELTAIEDLLRIEDEIQSFRFASTKDGVIDLFHTTFGLRWDLGSLYKSLTLPVDIEGYGTTRDLFDEIAGLLQKHVMLPSKECSLLAYWSIATWLTDYLPLLPSIVIRGPASTADLLLRTLAIVCCRPIMLGELRPAILRRLPIAQLRPTLLIREPHLNRYTSALLNASNQPGYLFFNGEDFGQL